MHIAKVELENIKSHIDSKFEFSPGTIAITGENGAGKTTILEAIAWTLFDVLDYKKEDFVRRGAKKGRARVTFVSGLDEREYVVYRDTATGYNVFDPRIGKRIADKREEVTRFLWQHLGLEAGTDLRALFKEAVGVPQGTLTAIFLGTPLERKSTFERLLKVEEYRQASEKLRETSRFVENRIADVNIRIARSEGELQRSAAAEEEFKTSDALLSSLSADADRLTSELDKKAAVVAGLDEREKALGEMNSALERARSELERARLICRQRESEFRRSAEAAERVAVVRDDAERHIALLGRLKELDRERYAREKLRSEQAKIETALATIRAEQKRIGDALESSQKAHSEISRLTPLIADQERLEKARDELKGRIAAIRATADQIRSIESRLTRLRESYKSTLEQLRTAEAGARKASTLSDLERRDLDLVRRVAELRASLERDERFQSEIRNGLCPVLSEKCLNLKNGQTLDGFVRDQFTELRSAIAKLETEHAQVSGGLAEARAAQEQAAALESIRTRENELAGEGKTLAEEKLQLEGQLAGLSSLEEELLVVERELGTLDDPRSRIKLLEAEASRETELRREISNVESNIERLESDRSIMLMQLESYKDLDAQWSEAVAEREATAAAYQAFLENREPAARLDENEKLFEAARLAADELGRTLADAEAKAAEMSKAYDRELHLSEREAQRRLDRQLAEVRASLDVTRRRRDELAAELERLADLRRSLSAEFSEKERLGKVLETTTFIRETLREAAPRVARNYVHHVSLEAALMFREICGRPEQTLCWSEDYGITLEDDGYERPFGNLSGGEQMAAALSVRLAILKQLSDIRIAFFDEPTTNMDVERRENLAQQISLIKNFDQLFVISHDDTFEGHVDYTLRVGDQRQ